LAGATNGCFFTISCCNKLSEETLWLSQRQLSVLFDRDRSVITKHLRNIFQSGELIEKSNVQKMHIAKSDKPAAY
jgi:hypothetical protein